MTFGHFKCEETVGWDWGFTFENLNLVAGDAEHLVRFLPVYPFLLSQYCFHLFFWIRNYLNDTIKWHTFGKVLSIPLDYRRKVAMPGFFKTISDITVICHKPSWVGKNWLCLPCKHTYSLCMPSLHFCDGIPRDEFSIGFKVYFKLQFLGEEIGS